MSNKIITFFKLVLNSTSHASCQYQCIHVNPMTRCDIHRLGKVISLSDGQHRIYSQSNWHMILQTENQTETRLGLHLGLITLCKCIILLQHAHVHPKLDDTQHEWSSLEKWVQIICALGLTRGKRFCDRTNSQRMQSNL